MRALPQDDTIRTPTHKATTTHEIGHGLGLGHSDDTGASMYFAIFIGSTHQRDPNADDIAGLEQLYPAPANQPPSAPTSIAANNVTDSQATISWSASSDPEGEAISYEIQFRKDDLSDNWSGSLFASETSVTITNLESDTTYRIRVRASDGTGSSDWTEASALFTTLPTNQQPTAPGTAWTTDVTDNLAGLAWDPSSDPEGDTITYSVQYRKDDLSDDWNSSFGSPDSSIVLTGLQSDETYRVRVRATDGQANGDWTETSRLFTTLPRSATYQIGEVGVVTDLTYQRQLVVLSKSYRNPVVFAQSASFNGADAVVVRVDNVSPNQFTMYLAEPTNLNGFHNAAETATYVVLEQGTHELSDGTRVEVGLVNTNATVGNNLVSSWELVNWNADFDTLPVVLTQIQTAGGAAFLKTRHDGTSVSGFRVALEQEESANVSHTQEAVGYLAVENGAGVWNELLFEASQTSEIYTSAWRNVTFQRTYQQPPAFLSSLATYRGPDSSNLRYTNLSNQNVEIKVEEDTTHDSEVSHTTESASYLTFGGTGPLTAVIPQQEIGEVGRINDLTHAPQTILLQRQYSNPVVFVQSPTFVGSDPISARVTDVLPDRFTVFLTEPSNLALQKNSWVV